MYILVQCHVYACTVPCIYLYSAMYMLVQCHVYASTMPCIYWYNAMYILVQCQYIFRLYLQLQHHSDMGKYMRRFCLHDFTSGILLRSYHSKKLSYTCILQQKALYIIYPLDEYRKAQMLVLPTLDIQTYDWRMLLWPFSRYDVELFQRIEHLIGKKLPLYQTEEDEVMVLMERVTEAQRYAKMVSCPGLKFWKLSKILNFDLSHKSEQ